MIPITGTDWQYNHYTVEGKQWLRAEHRKTGETIDVALPEMLWILKAYVARQAARVSRKERSGSVKG